MNTNNFTEILKNSKNITSDNSESVKAIIEEYPYFQAARAIYLKGLKNSESFKYNTELKKTAAYTTDRSVLFDYITSSEFIKEPKLESKEVHQQINEKISFLSSDFETFEIFGFCLMKLSIIADVSIAFF